MALKKLFPNAKLEETILGKVWLIPESDSENFEQPNPSKPPSKKEEK